MPAHANEGSAAAGKEVRECPAGAAAGEGGIVPNTLLARTANTCCTAAQVRNYFVNFFIISGRLLKNNLDNVNRINLSQ